MQARFFSPRSPYIPPLPLETGSHLATNPSSPLLLLSPFVCLSLSLPQSAPCQSERGSPSPSPSHLSFLLQGEGKGRGGDRRSRGQKFNLVLLSSSSSSLPSSSCFPTIFFSLPEEIANKTRCYFTPSHLETYFRFELERGAYEKAQNYCAMIIMAPLPTGGAGETERAVFLFPAQSRYQGKTFFGVVAYLIMRTNMPLFPLD